MWFFYDINFKNEHLDYYISSMESFFGKTFNGEDFNHSIDSEFFTKLKRTNLVKEFLKDFHQKYNELSKRDKIKVREAYRRNTAIENVCSSVFKPVKYTQLPSEIANDLRKIFNYLYDDFPSVKFFKDTLGSFKDYYNQFYEGNFSRYTLCPFCGIKPMKTTFERRREPFDHYLLRSQYPFVSLIRNNLVPMCHDCNEDYKKEKDISLRKVFYPFEKGNNDVSLSVRGTKVHISSERFKKEILSWDKIFEVNSRIEGYIKQNKAAIMSNYTELQLHEGNDLMKKYLEIKLHSCEKFLYCGHNFIEKAIILDEFQYILNINPESAKSKSSSSHENEIAISEAGRDF
ncbi:hypothetical protein [Bacillus marasmi]|uniref:hypothetical protein n=1 Tax=Bacillus marasmi TaxID=1926279 RepID=UPI0011C7F4B8|nr:hypothetical protein [Bacillus marasmi]